jgi:hypothetical protein
VGPLKTYSGWSLFAFPWFKGTGVGVGVEACVAVETLVGVLDGLEVFVGRVGDRSWLEALEGGLIPRRSCASCRGPAHAIVARSMALATKTGQRPLGDQRFMFSPCRFEILNGPFSFCS